MMCQAEDESWGPNSGCAEFMAGPEVHECQDEAVCVIRYVGAYDESIGEALCTRHRQMFFSNMPSWITVVAVTYEAG